MQILKIDGKYLIRLEIGEELVSSLTSVAQNNNIGLAQVQGIGALKDIELGYYDLSQKEYLRKSIDEIVELVSCTGNLTIRDAKPFAHLHVALGKPDFTVIGGHLFRGIVAVTAEIFVDPMQKTVHRKFDEDTALYLMDLLA